MRSWDFEFWCFCEHFSDESKVSSNACIWLCQFRSSHENAIWGNFAILTTLKRLAIKCQRMSRSYYLQQYNTTKTSQTTKINGMDAWVCGSHMIHLQSSASLQLWTLLLEHSYESEGWKKNQPSLSPLANVYNCDDFPSSALSAVHKSFKRSLRLMSQSLCTQVITDLCRKRSPFGSYCTLIGLFNLCCTIMVLV